MPTTKETAKTELHRGVYRPRTIDELKKLLNADGPDF
jgi:hypothetical protein